ncbi:hypothetical protein ABFS83_03G057300 [Erythranthe nasuta]
MEMGPIISLPALVTISILLTVSFCFLVITIRGRKIKKKLPPEAEGGWPIIGHLSFLSGPELPHIVLSNLADKYGPIFTIRLGVHRALIVSSWEIAKECFTTNDLIFCNRPQTAAIQHMCYNFAMFGFSDYGPYWRELRKISMLTLLSNRKVAKLGNLYETEVTAMMRSLYLYGEKVPLDMKKFFGEMTLGLIVRIVAGDVEKNKMDGLGVGSSDRWRGAINEFFRMMGVVTVPDVLPFLKWFDGFFGGTDYHRAFKKTANEMDSMLQVWLDRCKKNEGNSCDDDFEGNKGFMAEMMVASDRLAVEFPAYDADTINKAICQTMVLGSTDTTTATLTWALSLLLNNRHVITMARQELDLHVGRERQVRVSDVENLVYIKSIIKETLRLCPPTALPAPRESVEDCTVAGYHVPAGTRLFVNIWKLHRDQRVWPEPLEFKPERFLTTHKEVDVRGNHFELLPFGGGRRVCPGIAFALQMSEYALASLLHGFDIETVPFGEGVDMTGSFGATNMKVTPLEVALTPRLSPHLYA